MSGQAHKLTARGCTSILRSSSLTFRMKTLTTTSRSVWYLRLGAACESRYTALFSGLGRTTRGGSCSSFRETLAAGKRERSGAHDANSSSKLTNRKLPRGEICEPERSNAKKERLPAQIGKSTIGIRE